MNNLLEPTFEETISTNGADGSLFLPTDPVEVSVAKARPSERQIQEAQAQLDLIFRGEGSMSHDARFRKGMQDVVYGRETADASFYAHCENLASVANHAYDRPAP